MDFFDRQNTARRNTMLLVLALVGAVAVIVLTVLVLFWGTLRLYQSPEFTGFFPWLTSTSALCAATITAGGIAIGSIRRLWQLRDGDGNHIAELMDATLVASGDADAGTRRLVQVVEEMAVASGLPCPAIYILENEKGLNAFAAGTHPENAAVAVTRPLLDTLERDELQGVMAHEMSHIDNGDSRINMRLMALMAGITVVGMFGQKLWNDVIRGLQAENPLDASFFNTSILSRQWGLIGVLLGALGAITLIAIGWLGVFIARIIKAAISRHREFLADAASVQYTRHPDGIAGALLRIHNAGSGTTLKARHAEEISHMGFERIAGGLSGLTATHPPLTERMAALGIKYKQWLREQRRDSAESGRRQATSETDSNGRSDSSRGDSGGMGGGPTAETLAGTAENATAVLGLAALAALGGDPTGATSQRAQRFLRQMPANVRRASESPQSAAALVMATMLHGPNHAEADRAAIPSDQREAVTGLHEALTDTYPGDKPGTLDPTCRLPLLEWALPGLTAMDKTQADSFLEAVADLIRADGRLSIFELASHLLIKHQLRDERAKPLGMEGLDQRVEDLQVVLSLLAAVGHGDDATRDDAYRRGARALGTNLPPTRLGRQGCAPKQFTQALQRLDGLQPDHKERLIHAASEAVYANGQVRPAGAELLRAMAASLEVDIGPAMNGRDPQASA